MERFIDQLNQRFRSFLEAFTSRLHAKRKVFSAIHTAEWSFWQIALAGLGVFFLVNFYYVAFSRVAYPFDLEWMEGGAVDHVLRVLHGEKLYIEPNADFVPYIYTPLSYYLGALLSLLFGEGYLPVRLLSIISISVVFFQLFHITRSLTKSWLLGIAAAGMFSMVYPITNNWFDIGRVDSLFLALLLAGTWRLHQSQKLKDLLISALWYYLAYMTKQSAILIFPAFVIMAYVKLPKYATYSTALLILLVVVTNKIYNAGSDGWFNYYVFEVGSGHEFLGFMIKDFWKVDLMEKFKYISLLGLASLGYLAYRFYVSKELFWFLFGASFVGLGYFGRLHSGGDTNVLMPSYALLCLLTLFGLYRIHELSKPSSTIPRILLTSVIGLGVLLQGIQLNYEADRFIPTAADEAFGNRFIEKLKEVEGPIMISSHGFYQHLAGKKTNAQFMASYDLLRCGENEGKRLITESTVSKIEEQYYEMIIQDNDYFIAEVLANYDLVEEITYSGNEFMPRSGVQVRPTKVYKRKDKN